MMIRRWKWSAIRCHVCQNRLHFSLGSLPIPIEYTPLVYKDHHHMNLTICPNELQTWLVWPGKTAPVFYSTMVMFFGAGQLIMRPHGMGCIHCIDWWWGEWNVIFMKCSFFVGLTFLSVTGSAVPDSAVATQTFHVLLISFKNSPIPSIPLLVLLRETLISWHLIVFYHSGPIIILWSNSVKSSAYYGCHS